MSTVEGKKSDGSSISFHFKLDNGLPLKSIIKPNHKYMKEANTEKKALVIYLNDDELSVLNLNTAPKVHVFFAQNEIFLEINDYYLVIEEVPEKFLDNVEKSNVSYNLFKQDNTFIASYAM